MTLDTIDFAHAKKVVDATDPCLLPVKEAGILPADAYVSESFWEFEKHAIFGREWLCIGHVNEVPTPGDYLPVTVMDEPMLIVRDGDQIRVLSAVCRHRGHPLVGGVKPAPADGKCLHGRTLICPYHNWGYRLDGQLVGAPSMQETAPLSELKATLRLPEFRSEVFHGLVFVNFDEDAAPLAPRLKKLDSELATFGLDSLVPGHVFAQEGLGWNWKLHHENALEPYHTDYVHENQHEAVPAELTRFYEFDEQDGLVMRTTGFRSQDGDLFEASGVRRLPEIEGLTNEQRSRVLFVSLMPGAVMVLQPSVVTVTFLNPRSAGTIDTRRVNFYSRAATEVEGFDQILAEQFENLKIIIMQDQVTQAALQRAYRSRKMPAGRLSHLETAISQLNRWVIDKYRRGLIEADAV